MDNASMHGLEHPLSGARYELEPDGTVTVHHNGASGSFDGHGRWRAGEIRWADPLLCVWLTAKPRPIPETETLAQGQEVRR
jgi:hypothetical protein